MKILLDTCTFLWLSQDDRQISKTAYQLFLNPDHEIYLSAVSVWEMTVKYSLGRLELPASPVDLLPRWRDLNGIQPLPLDETAAVYESRLPRLHNDPFDRMLICQSIVHGMAILTPDADITRYPVHTLWS